MLEGIVLIAVVVLLAVWGVAIYNRLVRLRALVKEGFSGITVQLAAAPTSSPISSARSRAMPPTTRAC